MIQRLLGALTRLPRGLLGMSVLLLGFRLYAAHVVGFGDSEALYVTYAQHPALTYRDHPGMVGWIGEALRGLTRDTVLTPWHVHLVTAIVSTLVPWLFRASVLAGRDLDDAGRTRADQLTWMFMLTPQLAVGLFGFTPDLWLSLTWLGSLYFACKSDSRQGDRPRLDTALAMSLLLAAAASTAKASGLILWLAIATWILTSFPRTLFRGASIAATGSIPALVYVSDALGGPMLRHRLGAQMAGGPQLDALARAWAGQLLYVSPIVLALLLVAAFRLVRAKRPKGRSSSATPDTDGHAAPASTKLLAGLTAVSAVALGAFMSMSPFAEPHWIAPVWLTLGLWAARTRIDLPRRWFLAATTTAGALTWVAHVWVLVPQTARFEPADPRARLAGELYGWPEAKDAIEKILASELQTTPAATDAQAVVLVGPYWTICAQVSAVMGPAYATSCLTPQGDDWDAWYPRKKLEDARVILFVTDDRFPDDPKAHFPRHAVSSRSRLHTFRGGRLARTFTLTLLVRVARA